jgi:hypothetical protein
MNKLIASEGPNAFVWPRQPWRNFLHGGWEKAFQYA